MWVNTTRYDLNFQETRFAPDFFEFGRSGRVYSRSESIRTEGPEFNAEFPLDGLTLRELAPGVVQISYRSHVCYDGCELEHANRSSIWAWSPEGWQMKFHQGTSI